MAYDNNDKIYERRVCVSVCHLDDYFWKDVAPSLLLLYLFRGILGKKKKEREMFAYWIPKGET